MVFIIVHYLDNKEETAILLQPLTLIDRSYLDSHYMSKCLPVLLTWSARQMRENQSKDYAHCGKWSAAELPSDATLFYVLVSYSVLINLMYSSTRLFLDLINSITPFLYD